MREKKRNKNVVMEKNKARKQREKKEKRREKK